jgi:thiamine-phosphate pyrophosphorylase
MLTDVTPAVTRALQEAQAIALQQDLAEVLPWHLLQGLLVEEEGRACLELVKAGLDLQKYLGNAGGIPRAVAGGAGENKLPLSPGGKNILTRSRKLAWELAGDGIITSDQLLLVLLEVDEGLRAGLEACGLDWDRLQEKIRASEGPPLQLEEPLQLGEMIEQVRAARILDASANRAREALRVVEDYCRFVLDDSFLTGELKTLRHSLTEILGSLPLNSLLANRETLRDVGTELTTPREQERHSLRAVVQANLKRLQEALRSLEEYGKLHHASVGQALEKLRYRSYTLEKAIIPRGSAQQRLAETRLYFLAGTCNCAASLSWTIQEAAEGGVQIFQLREKDLSDRELLGLARKVRHWTSNAGLLFIMNDRPDLARLAEADGVHLGQDDMSVKEARLILGPEALIGVSTHSVQQVRQAILDGADYLGVGPTFPSRTKDFAALAGLDLVRQAKAETSLPAFVLGGVHLDNLPEALAAGARRVAVSHVLGQAKDPRAVAQQFRLHLDHCLPQ